MGAVQGDEQQRAHHKAEAGHARGRGDSSKALASKSGLLKLSPQWLSGFKGSEAALVPNPVCPRHCGLSRAAEVANASYIVFMLT